MSDNNGKQKKKPLIGMFTFHFIVVIAFIVAISIYTAVPCPMSGGRTPPNYVILINSKDYNDCIQRLHPTYRSHYDALVLYKSDPVDYKAACKTILDKIERDKPSGTKE